MSTTQYTVDEVCINPNLLTEYGVLVVNPCECNALDDAKEIAIKDLNSIFKLIKYKSLSVRMFYECQIFKFSISSIGVNAQSVLTSADVTDMCLITCRREHLESAVIFNIKENKYVDVRYRRPHLDIEDDRGGNGSEIFWFMRSFNDVFEDLGSLYVSGYNESVEYIIENYMFVNDVFDFSSLLSTSGTLTKACKSQML